MTWIDCLMFVSITVILFMLTLAIVRTQRELAVLESAIEVIDRKFIATNENIDILHKLIKEGNQGLLHRINRVENIVNEV